MTAPLTRSPLTKALALLAILAATPLAAQEATAAPGDETGSGAEATDGIFPEERPDTLDGLKWEKRVLVVFADSPNDPSFRRQMTALRERPLPLLDRDVVVFTDTEPDGDSGLRRTFRPRGFMLVLVGKDGQIKLRKPFPWDVRELSNSIDKTPLRQQEIRDAQGERSQGVVPE
ncbi:DUF4174 domain-containing protein [Pseudooceanicola atlanticus]|uniref:DUF4174 domain-containing protein n=1 Tax=Pseudooceanicola atlanticus TaxID=1461694 RepID=UPI0009DCED57|nr:DUF4174 domain-containing protein [Pseudooceanicola atlanticus]